MLGQLTPVDIERLWTRIAATIEKAKADDPRELRKRIIAIHGAALRTQVWQLTPKYDDIVIDVGGRDTGSLRAALIVANTVLIPVQPRSFDIWAVGQIAELVAVGLALLLQCVGNGLHGQRNLGGLGFTDRLLR